MGSSQSNARKFGEFEKDCYYSPGDRIAIERVNWMQVKMAGGGLDFITHDVAEFIYDLKVKKKSITL